MIFLFFILSTITCALAEDTKIQTLPTINIDGAAELPQSQRSISWPTYHQTHSPVLSSPQLEDTLNSLNGVQMRSQGSPTFSIRGSAQSGRALTLFNDIPLNFASSFGAPQVFLPKEMIHKISVIKGPASLLYGSQAMAGSINFLPKKYQTPTATISLSDTDESFLPWRQNSLSHNSFHIATPLIKNTNHHTQISFFTEKDDGAFSYQTKRASGVRSFNTQNMSRAVVNSSSQWDQLHLSFDSIAGKQVLQSPGPTNMNISTRAENKAFLASLTPHYFFNESHSIKSKISFLSSNSEFLENSKTTRSDLKTWISQNQYIFDVNQKSQLQIFADYFVHHLDSNTKATQNQLELGALYEFYSLKKLKHQVGARTLTKAKKVLPTFISHYYFNGFDSWLSYSQGYKHPTLSDLFSASSFSVGNPNLQAEESEQLELGLKKHIQKKHSQVLFDIRLFHINYNNFIESFEISPGVFSRQNQGQGHSRGFDLETRYETFNFSAYLNYNFLDTKNKKTGDSFRLSPQHQISWGTTYKLSSLSFEIQNTHWYKFSDISNNQNVRLDDWQQWNFLVHTPLSTQLHLSFGLINAFDESKELTLNYPEPQRKYWLQLRYKFSSQN